MGSRVAKFIDDFRNTDRYGGLVRFAVIAIFSLLFIVPLVVVCTTIVVGITEHEEPTPQEWFQRVVGVDPDRFANIQHHTDQGFDFSHHFRFEFSDDAGIDAIINTHNLSRSLLASPLHSPSLPDWYTPNELPSFPIGRKYSNDAECPDVYSLFVDDQNKVAYFEHIHM